MVNALRVALIIAVGLGLAAWTHGAVVAGGTWILQTNFWNDSGVWKDSSVWQD